jgi:hypothetical protein
MGRTPHPVPEKGVDLRFCIYHCDREVQCAVVVEIGRRDVRRVARPEGITIPYGESARAISEEYLQVGRHDREVHLPIAVIITCGDVAATAG